MGKFITIKSEGQKTIFIDADKVNSVEIHRTGKNSEKKLLLLTADRHEDHIYIELENYDVDVAGLVKQIKQAGNDLIEVKSTRGVDENKEVYTEYISPKAIAYLQAGKNTARFKEPLLHVGLKGYGKKVYFDINEDTIEVIKQAFIKEHGPNIRILPATKAIVGIDVGSDLYIDVREITRISVDSTLSARIDMKNVGHLTFNTKTSKLAYEFECAVKRYTYDAENRVSVQSRDVLHQEMVLASDNAAKSLVEVTKVLAKEVEGMIEIPSYEADIHGQSPHFLFLRSSFVKPADVVGIDTEDSPDNERGIFNYYSIYFELSKETRGMMDHIRMDYPTAEERDHALEVYMQRCEALTAQENKPKPNKPPGSNGFKF